MSNIDERIVRMTFDNQMFEKNVATSIKTLNDLKAAMNFDNATASLGNIEKTIGNVNFSKLEAGIDSITKRFSTLGIAGMTVIQDLTRAAERMGMSLYNSTIGQIKTGGWNRATNIDKARFAIEGLKMSWDDLEPSISAAVNDTRFGFDEAATAASQLAASNVQVGDDMTNALKSIANVASQTGAEYSEIGHIYTVVAGNGKLMTEQMQQFSYRGFNAAAAMASVWGKTEAEVREMVSKGEVDFKKFSDAMNEYLGEGAQRANSTFEGASANMKAALSRIGQPFAKSYRDAMIPVFNTLKELIKDIKGRIEPLEKIFEDFAQKASHLFTGLVGKIDLSFVDWIVDKLQKAYNWFDGVMSKVTPLWSKATEIAEKASDTAKTVVETADYVDEMAQRFIRGDFGNGVEKRRAAMEELGYSYELIQNRVNELLGCSFRYDVAEEEATKTTKKNTEATKENAEEVEKATGKWNSQISFMENAANVIATWPKKIADAFTSVIDKDSAISKLATLIAGVKSGIEIVGKTILSVADGAIGPASETIAHLINIFMSIGAVIGSFLTAANKILTALGAFDALRIVVAGISNALALLARLLDGVVSNAANGLVKVFTGLGDSVVAIRAGFDHFIETIRKVGLTFAFTSILSIDSLRNLKNRGIDKIKNAFKNFMLFLGPVGKVITGIFDTIKKAVTTFASTTILSIPSVKKFKEKGLDFLNNGLKNFGSLVEGAKSHLSNFIDSIRVKREFRVLAIRLSFIRDAFKNFAKDGIDAVKNVFSDFIKHPFDLNNIKTVFGNLGKTLKSAFTNLFSNLPPIPVSEIKLLVLDVFDWIKNEVKNFKFPKINLHFKDDLINLLKRNGVFDKIAPILSTIDEKFKSIGIDISGAFKMANKNVSRFFENVKRSDALRNIHSQFVSLRGTFKKLKASGFEGFKQLILDFAKNPFDFSGIKTAFGNVVELIKDGFKGIELPKLDFSEIKKAVLDTIEWAKNKIKNFKFPKINIPFVKQLRGLLNRHGLLDKLAPVFSSIRDTLYTIGSGIGRTAVASLRLLGDGFGDLREKAGVAADKIRNFFEMSHTLPSFSKGIHGLSNAFKRLFSAFRNSKILEVVTDWFKAFGSIFTNYEGNIFTFIDALVEQISKPIGAAFNIITKVIWNFLKVIKQPVFFAFSTIASLIGNIISGIINTITKAGKDLDDKNVFKTIIDYITKIGKIIIKIKAINALKGLLDLVAGVGSVVKNVGKVLKSTSKVINQFANGIKRITKAQAKLIKAQARDLNATALLKTAGAILVLALAFKLLSTINWDQFEVGAAAIITIAGALAILMLVANRGKGGGDEKESAIDSIGAGLESLGKSLQKGLKNIGRAALIFAFVYAVKSILDTIKELTDFNWADAKNGIKIMGAIMAELVLSMALINLTGIGGSFGKNIGMTAMLLSITLAIKVIADSLKTLANVDEKGLNRAERVLKRMVTLFGFFAIIFNFMGNRKLKLGEGEQKKGFSLKPLLGMIGALLAITWSLSSLSRIKKEKLKEARNAISLVGIVIAALSLAIGKMAESIEEVGGKYAAISIGGLMLVVAEIVGAFILLDKLNVSNVDVMGKGLLMGIGSVALLALAVGKLASMDINPAGLKKAVLIVGGVGLVLTALAGILAGIDWLVDKFVGQDKFEKGLDHAGVLMEKFGGMIGKLLGGLLGGALEGIGDFIGGKVGQAFDALPEKLTTFMENMQPFLDAISDLSADGANAFLDVINALGAIFALDVFDKIFEKITGVSSFDDFGTKLEAFGLSLVKYSAIVTGRVNEDAVASSANAGKMLADLEAHIPNSGGKLAELLGDNTLGKMSLELVPFAKAIVKYSAIVSASPINEGAVESSANAGKMLADLEAHIPNTGGALANWIGDNTLKKFSEGLEPFAKGIVVYSGIVSANPINEDAVKSSANAGLILADLEAHIPNTGGSLATLIFGDNRLDEFGDRMYQFGLALVKYSTVISGNINYGAVTASKMAGQMLANLESSISNQGGFIEFMVGDNSIENFGTRLEAFGESMVNFSSILSGDYANSGTNIAMAFQSEVVEGVIGTIQKLVDFVNAINEGGDFDKFEENMSALEGIELIMLSQLEHLGEMLGAEDSDYQKSFEDIGKKVIEGLNSGIQNAMSEDDEGQSKSLATALVEGLADETLLSKVKTESETIGSTIAGAITGITEEDGELTAFTEGLITSFTEMLNTVMTAVSGQADDFIEVGVRWAAGIVTGLRSNTAVGSVTQAAKRLGDSALSSLRSMSSSFSSIGTGWASSLSTGLSSSQRTLNQSATTLGRTTGQAFTTAYQTATNNVFATTGQAPTGGGTTTDDTVQKLGRVVGEEVTEGISEGTLDSVKGFTTSVTTMAAYANSVMNEALDTNPVITPVLDMSNVQAGAGLMDSYLGGTFMMADKAAGYTSSLLSGVGTRQGSVDAQDQMNNMATQEALQGIRQDIRDLGESMSHMQMVMNNGALVGQIGRGMDKQLGSIQKFKERWA